MVMTVIPKLMACLAGFERIQTYLVDGSTVDQREVVGKKPHTPSTNLAIRVRNMTIHAKNQSEPILRDVDLDVKSGSFVICSGAVGSGKTLLIKIILGELPHTFGSVQVSSSQIGVCTQSAWLPNGTIKSIICAFDKQIDEDRYQEAVRACCLEHDLDCLSKGDNTRIGSRGMNLSGGQRQRVVGFLSNTHGPLQSDI